MEKEPSFLRSAIVRLAGDSGDGMQLLGSEWVKACAHDRNDLSTMPDFPAEIRAPAGTLAGVSGFQIQFANHKIFTAGDQPEVLVALNPAALKANIKDLSAGGLLIVNSAAFSELALKKAGYNNNPLEDGSLSSFQLIAIDMNSLLRLALKETELSTREIQKCKNFFCLGLLYWLFSRDQEKELRFIEEKFSNRLELKKANLLAFQAGFLYGENTETFPAPKIVNEAPLKPGIYRALTGNKALALGLITASAKANLELFYASYPITPASDVLHELAHARAFGATTFQAEDEMAAICAAIGASYGGSLGVTATSGPGFALKAEALGYAVMVELPLIVIDVQRAGPSTGMPTKTEQGDLLQAIYGRHGEAPLPVIAAFSQEDCFNAAIDAARIAINFMTPVVILSDAFIANSSAPWKVAKLEEIEPIALNHEPYSKPFRAYERNKQFLSRAWVLPGKEDTIHQLGGLEKDMLSGKVSYDPDNHQRMSVIRSQKVDKVKKHLPAPELFGDKEGDVLLVGFGGTFGAIRQATIDLQNEGHRVAHLHIRLMNPIHDEVGDMMRGFKKVVVVEQNQGQLRKILRAQFLIDASGFTKMTGKPFLVEEIISHVKNSGAIAHEARR
ncbi:MAG: 2-oxoacid:acceptor oxidoreductase subunit alpha [Myxococcales bacterium]|nr:MAG: 2-oxoacid:acceptor oxidoreductase subunit alpha [Myxococcales bacterium]